MSDEQLLWGIIPSLFILIATGTSLFISKKSRRAFDYFFSILILLLSAFSLWYLFQIFVSGAYPTFVPHIVVVVILLLLFTQILLHGKRANH